MEGALTLRDARWTEALAVGSQAFIENIKGELGLKALHRELERVDGTYALRESGDAYSDGFALENAALRPENALYGTQLLKFRKLAAVRPRNHHIDEFIHLSQTPSLSGTRLVNVWPRGL